MRWLLILVLIVFSVTLQAQNNPIEEIDLQQFIEETFTFQDDDINYDELYEALLLYYNNPLNLNEASKDELSSLLVLSASQVNSLIEYRDHNGPFLSIYELQVVPKLDLSTIYKLIPFITVEESGLNVSPKPLLNRIFNERNNYLLLRYERTLEKKRGFTTPEVEDGENSPSRYLGSQGKHYARFRVSHRNDFSIGFTAEKDAGEEYTWDPQTHRYGADYYSFHFQLENKGKLKKILIGDYQLQFGQGLLAGSGFSVGKGAETITTVRRSNLGIRPYTSVLETGFFRGVTATYQISKNIEFTPFYSRLRQDAILRTDTTETFDDFISSIQSSGFHRTESQIESKNQIVEQTFGGNFLFQDADQNLQVGLTAIGNNFDTPIIRSDQLYNRFEFRGTNNYNIGVFGSYYWQNITLFGEMARSKSGGIGAVGGAIISLTPKLETSILIRNYDKDFHSFYGSAFGESATRNINEKGWYWGLKYSPSRKYFFTAYFDQFTFPWVKFGINAPSSGYEYLLRANYKPKRSTLLYFQFRQQSKYDNPSNQDSAIQFPLEGIKRNYLANLDLKVNNNLSLKSRVQFSDYQFNGTSTSGFAIMQDIYLIFWKIKLSSRFAIFETDDFENRQYAYERDVLYAFSIPAYFGVGTRQYVLLQYGITRKIDLYARYARTHYRDRDEISSGLETIEGDRKTDLKFQIRIKF